MIEQYHEVYVRDLDDGQQEIVSYRWRVDLPPLSRNWLARRWEDDWHERMSARAAACRKWCVANLAVRVAWCRDALGPENNGRTWRVTGTRALFANQEDAMMYQLAWS